MDVDDYVEGQKDNSDSNEQGFSVGKVVKYWERLLQQQHHRVGVITLKV